MNLDVSPRQIILLSQDTSRAVELTFRYFGGTGSCDSIENGEYITLYYQNLDTGANYVALSGPYGNIASSIQRVALPAAARGPRMRFIWYQPTQSCSNCDMWGIDDVSFVRDITSLNVVSSAGTFIELHLAASCASNTSFAAANASRIVVEVSGDRGRTWGEMYASQPPLGSATLTGAWISYMPGLLALEPAGLQRFVFPVSTSAAASTQTRFRIAQEDNAEALPFAVSALYIGRQCPQYCSV